MRSDPANGDDITIRLSIEDVERGAGNLPARLTYLSPRSSPELRVLPINDHTNRNKQVATIEFSAHWEDDTDVIQREVISFGRSDACVFADPAMYVAAWRDVLPYRASGH